MQFSYLFFAASVLGHGLIISPPARAVGPAMISACGESVAALVTADNTSHVEGMPEAALKEKSFNAQACNVFLCKGLQFQDNMNNVQTFRPGQVVNMRASITIPHEGPMNVSIVNTKMNMPVGDPLITFTSYADETLPVLPPNNTNFDVTIPMNLGSACSIAGSCVSYYPHSSDDVLILEQVLQWFWFGTAADQTYESCVDMVVGGVNANNGVRAIPRLQINEEANRASQVFECHSYHQWFPSQTNLARLSYNVSHHSSHRWCGKLSTWRRILSSVRPASAQHPFVCQNSVTNLIAVPEPHSCYSVWRSDVKVCIRLSERCMSSNFQRPSLFKRLLLMCKRLVGNLFCLRPCKES